VHSKLWGTPYYSVAMFFVVVFFSADMSSYSCPWLVSYEATLPTCLAHANDRDKPAHLNAKFYFKTHNLVNSSSYTIPLWCLGRYLAMLTLRATLLQVWTRSWKHRRPSNAPWSHYLKACHWAQLSRLVNWSISKTTSTRL